MAGSNAQRANCMSCDEGGFVCTSIPFNTTLFSIGKVFSLWFVLANSQHMPAGISVLSQSMSGGRSKAITPLRWRPAVLSVSSELPDISRQPSWVNICH